MLFNSTEFIFIFVPIVLICYLLTLRVSIELSLFFLTFSSLVFYSYWNPASLMLIIASMGVNYGVYRYVISAPPGSMRYWATALGIVFNLLLLAYFKYSYFILNDVLQVRIGGLEAPILPLAISFYTFQQISFLVDRRNDDDCPIGLLNYVCYVTFFPHLIAGPIVRHSEFLPQLRTSFPSLQSFTVGLSLFSVGLAKKVLVADTLSVWVAQGFGSVEKLTMGDAWLVALSYTFQLYFDFSGYSDMAIGLGMMFGFVLPTNFNSPYKAQSIADFWRRWHMTLSSFLRDYLYAPLGGNRKGRTRTYLNLMLTMLLGGLWHGAGWTFILWGGAHGLALVVNRFWSGLGVILPGPIAWFVTFVFVVIAWVLFRAPDLQTAVDIYNVAFGLSGSASPGAWGQAFSEVSAFIGASVAAPVTEAVEANGAISYVAALAMPGLLLAVLVAPNSMQIAERVSSDCGWRSVLTTFYCGIILALSLKRIFEVGAPTEFLYFQF